MKFNYWDNHYLNGGVSGEIGKHDQSRHWKMEILQEHGVTYDSSVIDIGCGDMEFWREFPIKTYTGIDISPTIIKRNQLKFPNYKFYCHESSYPLNISADYVICFDMLFHIMDTTTYIMTLNNLAYYTRKKLFISTWNTNPFTNFKNRLLAKKPFAKNMITDGKFQYYRDFNIYSLKYLESSYMDLLNIYTDERFPYNALYVYEPKKPYIIG